MEYLFVRLMKYTANRKVVFPMVIMTITAFCHYTFFAAYLRPSNIDGAKHFLGALGLLVKRIRQVWPRTRIVVRANMSLIAGSSPRTWGIRRHMPPCRVVGRFIPTYVGEQDGGGGNA
jgi:hypothetical protein